MYIGSRVCCSSCSFSWDLWCARWRMFTCFDVRQVIVRWYSCSKEREWSKHDEFPTTLCGGYKYYYSCQPPSKHPTGSVSLLSRKSQIYPFTHPLSVHDNQNNQSEGCIQRQSMFTVTRIPEQLTRILARLWLLRQRMQLPRQTFLWTVGIGLLRGRRWGYELPYSDSQLARDRHKELGCNIHVRGCDLRTPIM